MRFWPLTALTLILAACAPGVTTQQPSHFRAAFSEQGVVWVTAGRACVARTPEFQVVCPELPTVVDVAWHGSGAWAALPGPGLVVTLDGAPRSVQAGAVAVLSSTHIYREDGSALTYSGQVDGGVAGRPSRAVTGGDGLDYVLLAGQLRRVSDGALLENAPQPHLVSTATGISSAPYPMVTSQFGSYRLNGDYLERVDSTGQVLQRVSHRAAQLGWIDQTLLTIANTGQLYRWTPDLRMILMNSQ